MLMLLLCIAGLGTPEEPFWAGVDPFQHFQHCNAGILCFDCLKDEVNRLRVLEVVKYAPRKNSTPKKLAEVVWEGWQKQQAELLGG